MAENQDDTPALAALRQKVREGVYGAYDPQASESLVSEIMEAVASLFMRVVRENMADGLLWDYMADWHDSKQPILFWPLRENEPPYPPGDRGTIDVWGTTVEVVMVPNRVHPRGAVLADAWVHGSEDFKEELRWAGEKGA